MGAHAAVGYWATRRDFAYYREVVRLAREHAPAGGSVLDVGASETEVLERLEWFERRVAVDVGEIPSRPGIEAIVADFEDFERDRQFDLVLCLQVLEHIADPAPFARKLLDSCRIAIVSVPYRWPGWVTDEHVHDPVDGAKLRRWTAREPVASAIAEDLGMERLISVYDESETRST